MPVFVPKRGQRTDALKDAVEIATLQELKTHLHWAEDIEIKPEYRSGESTRYAVFGYLNIQQKKGQPKVLWGYLTDLVE
jgi:hypothetical protein